MDAELFKGEISWKVVSGFTTWFEIVTMVLSPTYGGSASASVSEGFNVIVTCLFLVSTHKLQAYIPQHRCLIKRSDHIIIRPTLLPSLVTPLVFTWSFRCQRA
jgi:hypothetical protein